MDKYFYDYQIFLLASNHCIGAGDFSGGRLTTRPNWPRKVHEMKSTVEPRQSGNCAKCSVTNWSLVIWLGLGVKRGFYGYAKGIPDVKGDV